MRGPERRSTVEEHSSGTLGESEECRMRYIPLEHWVNLKSAG